MKDRGDSATRTPDQKILDEAKDRFKLCVDWESDQRKLFLDDVKFAWADADNKWQWEDDVANDREVGKKPILTVNKVRQHNNQIINDGKQNKPSVTIRPTGGGASYQAAKALEGLVRHIERQSNAPDAYDNAYEWAVDGGIGYWRLVTRNVELQKGSDPATAFNQNIFIEPVPDPLSVYMDPDIKQQDGSDARFGFVFDDMPKARFEKEWPEVDPPMDAPLDITEWSIDDDHVRIVEYYRAVETKDEMLYVEDDDGAVWIGKRSEAGKLGKAIDPAHIKQRRDIVERKIEWFKIAGNRILDRKDVIGKYIPIVRVVGKEKKIDGRLERKGHTRQMKDPQRMYNYWTSAATECVALQTMDQWMGPAKAFEGLENEWEEANRLRKAWRPYNHVDDQNQPIPKPEQVRLPEMARAYLEGMQTAQNELMMSSGQYQSQFGQNENATSGKAINERQRQGDNATYDFIDNLATAIRLTGNIIINWVPYIYDTKRVIQILAEDDTELQLQIDPTAAEAYQQEQKKEEEASRAILNPNIGVYFVESDIGPNYATKRQEAFNAFSQIVSQNQALTEVIGDILFRNADMPGADEVSERFKRMLENEKPWILGRGPGPAMQALQGQLTEAQKQNQSLTTMMTDLMQKLAEERTKNADKSDENKIKEYDAESKRITAISNAQPELSKMGEQGDLQGLVRQTIMEMLGGGGQQQPQEPEPEPQGGGEMPDHIMTALTSLGGRQAQDGNWYVPDPSRPGKYMQHVPLQ